MAVSGLVSNSSAKRRSPGMTVERANERPAMEILWLLLTMPLLFALRWVSASVLQHTSARHSTPIESATNLLRTCGQLPAGCRAKTIHGYLSVLRLRDANLHPTCNGSAKNPSPTSLAVADHRGQLASDSDNDNRVRGPKSSALTKGRCKRVSSLPATAHTTMLSSAALRACVPCLRLVGMNEPVSHRFLLWRNPPCASLV